MTPEQLTEMIKELELQPHDFIVEAILLARVKDMDTGAVGISISTTEDTDWITQLGMLRAAEIITTKDVGRVDGQN